MGLRRLNIQPGINSQQTQSQNTASWWASNLVRWRDNTVERLAGWQRLFNITLAGLARALWGYEDLQGANDLLIGTDGGAQLYSGGNLYTFDLLAGVSNVPNSDVSTAAQPLFSVDYINGNFFAANLGIPGVGYISSNATSWTLVNFPKDYNGNATGPEQFAFGDSVYVSGGRNSLSAMTSPDGINWTISPNHTPVPMNGIAFGNSVFVAVNIEGQVITSPDGVTWTQRTPVHTFGWSSVAFGNSTFVAVTSYSVGGSVFAMTSSNGISWTGQSGLPAAVGTGFGWTKIRYINNLFIVVSQNNSTNAYTSPDGVTWTLRTLPANSGFLDAAFGHSLYVLVGNSSTLNTSPSIMTSSTLGTGSWTTRTPPNQPSGKSNQFTGIAFDGSTNFITVADLTSVGPPYMALSVDGITWTAQSYGNTTTLTVTDTTFSPTVGSQITLPVRVSVGGTILTPATYTVTTVTPSTNTYTVTLPGSGVGGGATAIPPLFVINQNQVGTEILTVIFDGHGYSQGQFFPVDVLTPIPQSGVTLTAGSYLITQVLDANTLLINTGQVSTATNVNTSFPSGNYEGNANSTGTVLVWYDTAQAPASAQNWYLDNYGQDGLIVYTNSPLFMWKPPVDTTNVAVNMNTAPQINTGMLVAMPQAQIILWGTQPIIGSGSIDPLFIRFSDNIDPTVWTATASNQAGSYRLSKGSKIIGGIQMALVTLIWTDTDVWAMQYIGPPLIYGFNILASGCGLISPKARALLGGTCYWMSQKQFWVTTAGGGGASQIYCPVWDTVFNDLDPNHLNKINAGTNSAFNEVWFFYPSISGGTGECDKYVKITIENGGLQWDTGVLPRTTWMDQSVFGNAMGGDLTPLIQQHDIGYNADGQPMAGAFIETGYANLSDGETMMTIDEIIPDAKWFGTTPGALNITLKTVNYPLGPINRKGPFGVDMANRHIRPRLRARQIAMRVDWVTRPNYNARIGAVSIRAAPSGRRP